jgi:hypothetical protein
MGLELELEDEVDMARGNVGNKSSRIRSRGGAGTWINGLASMVTVC